MLQHHGFILLRQFLHLRAVLIAVLLQSQYIVCQNPVLVKPLFAALHSIFRREGKQNPFHAGILLVAVKCSQPDYQQQTDAEIDDQESAHRPDLAIDKCHGNPGNDLPLQVILLLHNQAVTAPVPDDLSILIRADPLRDIPILQQDIPGPGILNIEESILLQLRHHNAFNQIVSVDDKARQVLRVQPRKFTAR